MEIKIKTNNNSTPATTMEETKSGETSGISGGMVAQTGTTTTATTTSNETTNGVAFSMEDSVKENRRYDNQYHNNGNYRTYDNNRHDYGGGDRNYHRDRGYNKKTYHNRFTRQGHGSSNNNGYYGHGNGYTNTYHHHGQNGLGSNGGAVGYGNRTYHRTGTLTTGPNDRVGNYRRPTTAFYYRSPFYYRFPNQIPIEELMTKYNYVEESDKPKCFVVPGTPCEEELVQLSDQVWTKFQKNQQTREMFRKKLELWRELQEDFKVINPMYQLEIVGSTISGFGSNSSDIDICLLLNHRNETDPRGEAIDILELISPRIELLPNLVKTELILAKVPILKLKEQTREIDIDINVNNSVGLRNTSLLHAYGQVDWRVRPLVLVVKLWASCQGINDAKCMTLSSYSLALMVIHYLQHGVSPPILPSLQNMFPERFASTADLSKVRCSMMDTVQGLPKSENTESLGELLIGFLEYFAIKFDYKNHAICVRTGGISTVRACAYKQALKNDAHQWKFINIEGGHWEELKQGHYHFLIAEPFEHTNTARSVYDKEAFDRIRGVFYASWQRLQYTHDLESIFSPTSPSETKMIGSRIRIATAEIASLSQ